MATREEIREEIVLNVEGANYTGLLWHFPMTIPMPCGKIYHYAHPEVFPLEDTPCDCGDPDHFVIRYEIDEEPPPEPEPEQSPKCAACEGRGFIEYESGLIQVECEVCKGTGRVLDEVESINPMMITDIEAVNDSSSGTGQLDSDSRSEHPSKPKQRKKRKAKATARKRSS